MKMHLTMLAASIAIAVACGDCDAQVVRNGSTVLVDDGTCGKGMLKLVTVTHGNAMPGAPLHETKCVPK